MTQDRWICFKRVEPDNIQRNGQNRTKVWYDLIFGHTKTNKAGNEVAVGDVFHSLDGPTAYASISSFAEDLNIRNVPPTSVPSFTKTSKIKNDPAQMSLLLVGKDLGKTKNHNK